MPGDDRHQHKFYCTDRVWDTFLQWLSHKYPIFMHGMISAEIQAAIIERMTTEKVSTNAHTQKFPPNCGKGKGYSKPAL